MKIKIQGNRRRLTGTRARAKILNALAINVVFGWSHKSRALCSALFFIIGIDFLVYVRSFVLFKIFI
jgi:hypothetical protein